MHKKDVRTFAKHESTAELGFNLVNKEPGIEKKNSES